MPGHLHTSAEKKPAPVGEPADYFGNPAGDTAGMIREAAARYIARVTKSS